jgi:hypothetical protein
LVQVLCFAAPLIMLFGYPSGCLHTPQQPAIVAEVAEPVPCPPDRTEALLKQNAALQQALRESKETLGDREAKIEHLEQDILNLNLRLFELESIAKELQQRSDNQQQRLETAIVDVVRSKAKLRSIESKAEAVSTLAEAEIAVKALKRTLSEMDTFALEELSKAENLLSMSADEYQKQNFGGALYLANQSKNQVRTIQDRIHRSPASEAVSGESPFYRPLHFKVRTNSNLRDGPSLAARIIGKLDRDTSVVGYAAKEDWVRIKTQEGVFGWVFRPLVETR